MTTGTLLLLLWMRASPLSNWVMDRTSVRVSFRTSFTYWVYKKGIGCEKSIYQAFVQWTISVQNGGRGFAEIGDCYRLGAGCVEQNFNEAMKYYQKAVDNDEPRFRGVSPDEWLSIPDNLENDDLYEEYFIDEDPDDDEDEDWDDETSFECRCCHCRILREDVEDPEIDICDDCRYSGNELARD